MFKGELLPYQVEAVDKMYGRGKVLVAYDLGLGKTVLTIAAIERLLYEGDITRPGIVVCLSSLKYQWQAQIEKFSDSKAIVIDGTKAQREKQYETAMEWKHEYIIMNYEQVVNDWEQVSKLPRGFVVLDEATAIKSFRSKRSKYVKQLTSEFKFALTGTPVENGKAEELFSIMQFVDKNVFGRFDIFDKTYIVRNYFGGVLRYKNIPKLVDTLAKAAVRKRQSDPDVAPYLPKTIFAEPILVPLDSANRKLHSSIVFELTKDLDEAAMYIEQGVNIFGDFRPDYGPIDDLRGRIMPKLLALRMLCDHPMLLNISADLFKSSSTGEEGSSYAAELVESGKLGKTMKSPKLAVLKEIADNFLENEDNKLVIFSSFVSMVGIIAEELTEYGALGYTGRMSAKEKEAAKLKFQTDPKCRVLVSSDAGGYGVDLPQANMLINYDLPWNAGLAIQRNGRIQRASSEWEHVVIQDILIKDSIEERQHAMLQQKMSVANAIIDGSGTDENGELTLTLGSLRQFLQEISG